MSAGEDPCPEHHEQTLSRRLRYCFYNAHHGRGAPDDSQWADDLSEAQEFAIFDEADFHDISDSNGNLYGIRRGPDDTILALGTDKEQIAKFWEASRGSPWHGFPLWPLAEHGSGNRKRQPAPREALVKMEKAGLLVAAQRKRLQKGDHV